MNDRPRQIARELSAFSDSLIGSDWTREWFSDQADTRYRVFLDAIRGTDALSLLDVGCGYSPLLEYIERHGLSHISYSGMDLSQTVLAVNRERHPDVTYYNFDVLDPRATELPRFDYVFLKQIFTYRGHYSDEEMFAYLRSTVGAAFALADKGVVFNVMSPHVDYRLDDLFHLPVDQLLTFLAREISRHVVIRHDYGLYEYTAYVYREPTDPDQAGAKRLVTPRT